MSAAKFSSNRNRSIVIQPAIPAHNAQLEMPANLAWFVMISALPRHFLRSGLWRHHVEALEIAPVFNNRICSERVYVLLFKH